MVLARSTQRSHLRMAHGRLAKLWEELCHDPAVLAGSGERLAGARCDSACDLRNSVLLVSELKRPCSLVLSRPLLAWFYL